MLAGVGHREDARTVVLEAGMKLIRQKVAGVAVAVAQRAAALDHEVLDHAVKNQPIKKWLSLGVGRKKPGILAVKFCSLGQPNEVGDDERHFLVFEPGRHLAEARRDLRINAVRHHVGRRIHFHSNKKG